MIGLIITIALLGLIYWIATVCEVPQPFLKIILVVLLIFAILSVLNFFGILYTGQIDTGLQLNR